MDQQRRGFQLGWLDKLAIKNGSLLITALSIALPLYNRFVATEHSLNELRKSVDKLSTAVTELHQELAAEKSNSAMLALRLSILERQQSTPRLFDATDHQP